MIDETIDKHGLLLLLINSLLWAQEENKLSRSYS